MNTITTSKARCRDCYKCIRQCPVKAIGLKNGQAWVSEEKCILCGQCIKACPQKAKSTVSQISQFEELLRSEAEVVVSLAPSYLATTFYDSPWKMVAALYALGVKRIEETAVAAEWVAEAYAKNLREKAGRTTISSCCPVVVHLIEKYYPGLVPLLPGVVSPMIAHARQIRVELGAAVKVVFIGPCFGKKAEAEVEAKAGELGLDAVLTFEELAGYLQERGLRGEELAEAYPDVITEKARFFPLQQGILTTMGLKPSLGTDVLTISGIDECMETFRDLQKGLLHPRFVEALACKGGCTGGPAIGRNCGFSTRKECLFQNAGTYPDAHFASYPRTISLTRRHDVSELHLAIPSEKEIREILALTGKNSEEDETNCGGCGYSSCREKAIAVYQGMAEPEMCIPYMKNKAESFSNMIVDTTLNAIIVADQEMIIQKYNPAAARMFGLPLHEVKGERLQEYIDPIDFQKVFELQKVFVGQRAYSQNGIVTRQVIYPLPKYGVVIGIITDMTVEEERKAKFDAMKQEAIDRANKVIHEQMRIAQEIAGLLGESTSETKATLMELMQIMEGEVKHVL